MSRRYSETARLLEFALDLGQKVVGSVNEVLPEEAKHHLANAQREIIQALVVVYEQQAGTRRAAGRSSPLDDDDVVVRSPRSRSRRRPAAGAAPTRVTPASGRGPRSTRIDVK